MICREELIAYLNDFLEAEQVNDYGPQGLQVEGKEAVNKVVTAVTASVELFKKAIQAQADLILVHHGIIWDRDSHVLKGGFRERVRLLLQHEITLLAYHLPLDSHPLLGNNILGARGLGLERIVEFGDCGVKGSCAPCSIQDLTDRTRKFFSSEPLVFPTGPEVIRQVGFCSGSAPGKLDEAIDQGLDAYITGEVSLPVMHAAREGGIHFIAAGHYATECSGIIALGDHLADRFGLEVEFIDIPNPV